jgi:hypothetical protein
VLAFAVQDLVLAVRFEEAAIDVLMSGQSRWYEYVEMGEAELGPYSILAITGKVTGADVRGLSVPLLGIKRLTSAPDTQSLILFELILAAPFRLTAISLFATIFT